VTTGLCGPSWRRGAASCAVYLAFLAAPVFAQTPARPRPALDREQTLKRAADELAAGRRDEAARLLRSAADEFQSVQALLQLARLQSGNRDAAGALDSLNRALKIAPNSEEVLSALAQLALAVHVPIRAITVLDPLTRLCPTVATYHYLLGVAMMQIGDMGLAVDSLKEAERLEPDRPVTLLALGLALNNRKLYDQARPLLLRSLELDPESADAIAALAESEEGVGDLSAAETHARRALERSGANPSANLVLGLLFMKQQRYEDARDAFVKVVTSDPDSSKGHYQLSLACARLGDDACSQAHLDLYKQKLRETEGRVQQLRTQTGLVGAGARR
jgi:tetratricopeptide (TPR) repeat protein